MTDRKKIKICNHCGNKYPIYYSHCDVCNTDKFTFDYVYRIYNIKNMNRLNKYKVESG